MKTPKAAFATEEPADKQSNVYEYDLEQWNSNLKGSLIQLCILGFIHYKWQAAIPLLSQLILGPTKLYSSELFQSYVLGAKIERPFPAPKSPFGDLMKSFTGGAEEPARKEPKAKPIASASEESKKRK